MSPEEVVTHWDAPSHANRLAKSEAGKSSSAVGRDNEGRLAAQMWQRPSRYHEVIKCQAGEEGGGIIWP